MTEKSTLVKPGPRKALRPRSPKWVTQEEDSGMTKPLVQVVVVGLHKVVLAYH